MQRRQFISVSGISFAGLLLKKNTAPDLPRSFQLRPPDEVWMQVGKAWSKMLQQKPGVWTNAATQVSFHTSGDKLAVQVNAPTVALESIRCGWKAAVAANALLLGDHWERSYGDLAWQSLDKDKKAPWYLMIDDGKSVQCFGVATGANSICHWQTDGNQLSLFLDTRSGGDGVLLGQRSLHAADILVTQSKENEHAFATAHRFCGLMCAKPLLPAKPLYGINDWYVAYGDNSKASIIDHTARMVSLVGNTDNRPFSVIDAGWSLKSPKNPTDCCWSDDGTRSNDKFGDMSVVASEIIKLGMRPGLWVRPLCAKSTDRQTLLAPAIKDRNDPTSPILDPTIPENLETIAHIVGTYKRWGFQLVKHDYTSFDIFGRWGFQMKDSLMEPGWHFYDRTKTNAEIVLELYRTIRTAAQDMYLIGCNTESHLSAGLFEANRIGDDTSGKDWERTRKMGVNTLAFRIVQHQKFYAADADCVGITQQVPWEKNKQWLQLLAESSAPLFISAAANAVNEEQKQSIRKAFADAAKEQPLGEPLDWQTSLLPAKWKLNDRTVSFDW